MNALTTTDRTAEDAQAVLSARPTSMSFGKCTARLSTLVPDEIKDEFDRKALRSGYPSASDCLRELVMVYLRGADYLVSVHRERIDALRQNLTGIGTDEA